MTMPTLTCEHCEADIIVSDDPRCIQQGGMDVICEACRECAYDRWQESALAGEGPPSVTARHREAYRIKRGWSA
jgi:hypothetical protein